MVCEVRFSLQKREENINSLRVCDQFLEKLDLRDLLADLTKYKNQFKKGNL